MMKEYIEREKALKAACFWCAGNVDLDDDEPCCCAEIEEILNIPAADVVEIKHGKWDICCDGYYPYCSECGYEPPYVNRKDMRTPYCPNCGANMDGGNK